MLAGSFALMRAGLDTSLLTSTSRSITCLFFLGHCLFFLFCLLQLHAVPALASPPSSSRGGRATVSVADIDCDRCSDVCPWHQPQGCKEAQLCILASRVMKAKLQLLDECCALRHTGGSAATESSSLDPFTRDLHHETISSALRLLVDAAVISEPERAELLRTTSIRVCPLQHRCSVGSTHWGRVLASSPTSLYIDSRALYLSRSDPRRTAALLANGVAQLQYVRGTGLRKYQCLYLQEISTGKRACKSMLERAGIIAERAALEAMRVRDEDGVIDIKIDGSVNSTTSNTTSFALPKCD